jgi:proteasome accessory factor C
MVNKFDRIQQLHRLLRSNYYPTSINKIVEKLECTNKTAKIAIVLLCNQLHAPIAYCQQTKDGHGEKDTEAFELPGLWLPADELHGLTAILNIFKKTNEKLQGNEINIVLKLVKKLLAVKGPNIDQFSRTIKYLTTSKRPVANRFFSIITDGLIFFGLVRSK